MKSWITRSERWLVRFELRPTSGQGVRGAENELKRTSNCECVKFAICMQTSFPLAMHAAGRWDGYVRWQWRNVQKKKRCSYTAPHRPPQRAHYPVDFKNDERGNQFNYLLITTSWKTWDFCITPSLLFCFFRCAQRRGVDILYRNLCDSLSGGSCTKFLPVQFMRP